MKRGFSFFILLILSINFLYAVEVCPFGLEEDPYPGECGRYIDTNKDKLCDLSQDLEKANSPRDYNFIAITLITVIIYALSFILIKIKIISIITHKKIWNILLLLSFIITALTSIAYLLKTDLSISTFSLASIGFWHIEIGLIMILISLFHALWHIPYFKSYLK